MTESFNHFQALANALPEVLGEIVDETATDAVSNIQGCILANGQINTGYMYDSVYKSTFEGSTYVSDERALPEVPAPSNKTEAYVAVAAEYGVFQNYGTSRMPGIPFFDPGISDTVPQFEDNLSTLEDRLKRLVR